MTFKEDFNQAVSEMKQGYILAMMTDKFDIQCIECEKFDREKLFCNALEVRMFNEQGEIKWFRSSIDKELQRREIKDDEQMEYWDEYQYLDIDDKKTGMEAEEKIAYATGGGRYPLPIKNYNNAQVIVRNYLSYEQETNQVYISDWRLVGFKNGEE